MSRTKTRPRGKQGKKSKKGWRTASTSDRHELYELSVQEAESECDLIEQAWRELRTRKPKTIREDFCGTALVCREWVKRHPEGVAIGIDLDTEVLDWARARLEDKLDDDQRARITLLQEDVRTAATERAPTGLA